MKNANAVIHKLEDATLRMAENNDRMRGSGWPRFETARVRADIQRRRARRAQAVAR